MIIQTNIEKKLTVQLQPLHLQVVNESNRHNVPPNSESHFKVILVSDTFEGKTMVARHRMINKILVDELQNKIHALALHTYTRSDWKEKNGNTPMSPPCLGGGKKSS